MAEEGSTRRELLRKLLTLGPIAALAGAVGIGGAKTASALQTINDDLAVTGNLGVGANPNIGGYGGNDRVATISGTAGRAVLEMRNPSAGPTSDLARWDVYQGSTMSGGMVFACDGATNSSNATLRTMDNGSLGTRVTVDRAGNFGIGAPTPAAKLDVAGTTRISGDATLVGNVGIGCSPSSKLDVAGSGTARYFRLDGHTNVLSKINNNALQTNLTLENAGITAAGHGTCVTFNLGYGGDSNYPGTSVNGGRLAVASEQQWTSAPETQDSYMAFSTAQNGAVAERMRISSSGSVGIGTAPSGSAVTVLHVQGVSSGLDLESTTTGGGKFSIESSAYYNNRVLLVRDETTGALRMAVDLDGNVGIGTPTPTVKLDVAGPARIAGNLTLVGGILQGTAQTAQTATAAYYDS